MLIKSIPPFSRVVERVKTTFAVGHTETCASPDPLSFTFLDIGHNRLPNDHKDTLLSLHFMVLACAAELLYYITCLATHKKLSRV